MIPSAPLPPLPPEPSIFALLPKSTTTDAGLFQVPVLNAQLLTLLLSDPNFLFTRIVIFVPVSFLETVLGFIITISLLIRVQSLRKKLVQK